ncbi:MAG: PAS domain-containing protein, partial [Deltaproteobacteria bacterium]|nr:PAS domain-containing protein [Deltaproteobacteria bacterium]
MLRVKLLRNLMILSLAIAVLLPVYESLFVHPAYQKLLAEETEEEAVRYASYMVRSLGLENRFLTRELFTSELEKSLQPASRDKRLIKLRIFSAQGEIIFSTKAEEIGSINKKDYFRKIVANGRVYSKVVEKDRETADGAITRIDVVETYVPFMAGNAFGGAIEVYYDITESVSKLKTLSFHSLITTLLLSFGFLLAISIALYRAYVSFQERDKAEDALRLANEELELRVAERTSELSKANEQLTDQIAERTIAQVALNQALEDIRVDREKLEGILRSVPDGVVVADGELNVLHLNAAAESILAISLEMVLGQSIDKLNQKVGFLNKVTKCLNLTHGSRSFDFELPDENTRNSRIYQVRISQFVQDETEAAGIVLLIRDVTREREIERMKSAFLAMAAHELNTPLTTIIGYSELLTTEEMARNFNKKQQREFLQLIHDKSLALGQLIDDLLDISRIESGRPLILSYQEFRFDTMMGKVVASYVEEFSNHRFSIDMPDEAALICADRSRLEQVIDHL